jgi:sigma-B regulation protein RsbU (phosphoserine phosphatase)
VGPAPTEEKPGDAGVLAETLLGVAAALSSSSDFDTLLANILRGAQDVIRCAACSILLPDPATGDLLIHSTQRDWRTLGPWRLPKGQGIAGRVFESQQPVNIADAAQDPGHYARMGEDTGLPARALMTIPLMDGGVCRGVMQAMNPSGRAVFNEEDVRVFVAFGSLVSVTLARRQAEAEAKERAVAEAEREAELELARQVQATFLPEPEAERGSLRIRAFLEQATGIGGDCYFFPAPRPHLLLAGVGDVTGKGSSAALDMARLTTQIELAAPRCTPEKFADWLVELNNVLHAAMSAGENAVALTVLLFDMERRRVQIAAFAQFPPLCRDRASGEWQPVACPRQGFFGQRRLASCGVVSAPLAAGTHWLAHSDGITEALASGGGQVGREGLARLLKMQAWEESASLGPLVASWSRGLAGGARDDATLLVIEDLATPPPHEFSSTCTAESIREARRFFEQWGRFAGIADDQLLKLLVGCDEILTNVHKHAYQGSAGPLSCLAEVSPVAVRYVIRHRGAGLTQEQAEAQLHAPSREEGGLGLALVRRVFTSVRFTTSGLESQIVLEKAFS